MAKINDSKLKSLPISFSKLTEYDDISQDTRFTVVLIKLLSIGKNYNGSIFTKPVVEDALSSLANIPIVGYIEPNKDNDEDFSDHRVVLSTENGQPELLYLNSCYGVVPESFAKEAYFKEELCSDGISREYLFVKGLLFSSKFGYVLDIFNDNNGEKSQSMELDDSYEGHWSEDGFVFDKFKFSASCILGKYVSPAIIDSEITTNFSYNKANISQEIENKLNEFAKYFNKKEDEGMAKKIIEEQEAKENFSQEPVKTEGEEFKKKSKEQDSEEPVKEEMACGNKKENMSEVEIEIEDDDNDVCPECGNNPCTCEEDGFAKKSKSDNSTNEDKENMACGDKKDKKDMSKEDGKKKYTLTFSLSHEDIANQLYEKLWDMGNIENTYYYIVKTMDNYFIYCDCMTNQFYEQGYLQSSDSISFIGERKEVFSIFVDQETRDSMTSVTYSKLKKDLQEAQSKIQEYSKANEELLKFQLEVKEKERKTEIDGVISRFSKIDALDLEKYRQQAYNKEINNEQLEEKLFAHMGRMNFSMNTIIDSKEEIQAPINYSVSLVQEDKKDDFIYGEDIKKYFK